MKDSKVDEESFLRDRVKGDQAIIEGLQIRIHYKGHGLLQHNIYRNLYYDGEIKTINHNI